MRREQRGGRGARSDTSSFGCCHEVIRSYAVPTQSCLYTHVGTNVRIPDDMQFTNRFAPSNCAVQISSGCFFLDELLLRGATGTALRNSFSLRRDIRRATISLVIVSFLDGNAT
jgi:hypothetical protein